MFHVRQLPWYSDVHRYDHVREFPDLPGCRNLSRLSHVSRHGNLRG